MRKLVQKNFYELNKGVQLVCGRTGTEVQLLKPCPPEFLTRLSIRALCFLGLGQNFQWPQWAHQTEAGYAGTSPRAESQATLIWAFP